MSKEKALLHDSKACVIFHKHKEYLVLGRRLQLMPYGTYCLRQRSDIE